MIALLATLARAGEVDDEVSALREEVAALRAELEAQRSADAAISALPGLGERVSLTGPVIVGPGEVVTSAVSFAGDVEVLGRVAGRATSIGGDVIVRHAGAVDGDATSVGGRVVVEPGGLVHGDRTSVNLPGDSLGPEVSGEPSFGALLYRRVVLTLSLAGAGVLAVGVFPARVGQVARAIEQRPFHAAAVGALATGFVVLFAGLITLVTLGLGLPVALLLLGALGAAWMLGFVGLSQAVGDHLPFRQRPHGRWVAFLVGVVLVTSIGSLPWVGWLVLGAAGIVGIGAALATRFGGEAA